jgi:hypothetical protein
MERTQIYIRSDQREALKAIANRTGQSLSELIRAAINAYIADYGAEDRQEIMRRTAGMWADREDLPEFFEELRREGDRYLIDELAEPLPAGH